MRCWGLAMPWSLRGVVARRTHRRGLPIIPSHDVHGSSPSWCFMTVLAAGTPLVLGDVLPRLGIDLAAVAALTYVLYLRRHGRRDLFVIYTLFNVGLFLAVVAMTATSVGAGFGFGLFAVLSIVRLRSAPFSNIEMAYFFIALVLALVCGLDIGGPAVT